MIWSCWRNRHDSSTVFLHHL